MNETPAPYIVAAIQASPVFLDCEATLEKVGRLVATSSELGAKLVVFPEAFLPGYPFWLWGGPSTMLEGLEQKAFAMLWREAIDVPGPETERLGEVARRSGVHLVIGVNERESGFGRATLFNTMLTFGSDGALIARHRKIMPTYRERTIWGQGDGSTLQVHQTALGRLGGLICWENYMPLARYHQYVQGVQVYTAITADASETWATLVRTIAAEGKTFVISVCQYFARADFAANPFLSGFGPGDDVLSTGGSMIIGPDGSVLAGPLHGEEGILTAEINLDRIIEEKHSLDVAGHYARPDIFRLTVNTAPANPYQSTDS